MFKMTDKYLDELDRKIETDNVTDQDEEEVRENITDVDTKMKKITYILLYSGLVSIIVGISSLFAYFYLHNSIYDTGEIDVIYFLYLGIGFLGMGGFFTYYSLNKMPLLTELNDEFEIEEDDE